MPKKKIDKRGYERGKPNHSDLISRQVAHDYLYEPNKEKYPLPFKEYVVHHMDGDKRNNDISNLQILTKEEHEIIHGKTEETSAPKQRHIYDNFYFVFALLMKIVFPIGFVFLLSFVIYRLLNIFLEFQTSNTILTAKILGFSSVGFLGLGILSLILLGIVAGIENIHKWGSGIIEDIKYLFKR